MFYLVFSKEDKEKMISNGAIFIKEENGAFLFRVNSFNFETHDIKYVRTNDLNF